MSHRTPVISYLVSVTGVDAKDGCNMTRRLLSSILAASIVLGVLAPDISSQSSLQPANVTVKLDDLPD